MPAARDFTGDAELAEELSVSSKTLRACLRRHSSTHCGEEEFAVCKQSVLLLPLISEASRACSRRFRPIRHADSETIKAYCSPSTDSVKRFSVTLRVPASSREGPHHEASCRTAARGGRTIRARRKRVRSDRGQSNRDAGGHVRGCVAAES